MSTFSSCEPSNRIESDEAIKAAHNENYLSVAVNQVIELKVASICAV